MSDQRISLHQIAHGRSGDKGNHANIGIIAFTDSGFAYLKDWLTADRVNEFFGNLSASKVERFELPGIRAFNYLLRDVLDGGGSRSLRIDSQGKTLGLALLEIDLPRPENLDEMVLPE